MPRRGYAMRTLCWLEKHATRAETESALANRLSKFLGGCDSFYDEPPLPLAVRFGAEIAAGAAEVAGKAPPPAPALRENAPSESRMSHQGGEENPGAGSAGSAESPGSRKRPCPGGLPSGSSHAPLDYIRQKEGEGDVGHVDGGRREDPAAAATRHGDCVDRNHREPAASFENCGERDQRNGGGGAAGERKTDEAGKLAEDGNNNGFAAPLFLTPPVIAVSEGGGRSSRGLGGNGSGGGRVVGSAAGATPQSASSSCYSASSTPTNGSASPALAVASPAGKAPWRSEGLGQPGLAVPPRHPPVVGGGGGGGGGGGNGGGGRKRARGNGSCSSLGGEERGVLRKENHRSHSPCSSPTPPSTGEPLSPPALSTEEGSSPAADGRGGITATAIGLAVGDAYGNGVFRGREREVIEVDGRGGSARNGFGSHRQVERSRSGGAGAHRSAAAESGPGPDPRRTSAVSRFVLRGPKTEIDDRDPAGWECRAGGMGAEQRGKARSACTGEAGKGGGAGRQEEGSSGTVNPGEEEEHEGNEEGDDDDDMADTGDTVEENALGVPAMAAPTVAAAAEPGALAAAAVEEGPEVNRNRRRSRRGEKDDSRAPVTTRGGGTGGSTRTRSFGRRQAKVEASQESEGSEEAFSWFGSQGQSGGGIKLEAGGTSA